MNRREPAHIDTAAVFVQNRLRGTLLKAREELDPWERMCAWRRVPVRVHNARFHQPNYDMLLKEVAKVRLPVS